MSFVREEIVKSTRKLHRCFTCRRDIQIGSTAVRWSGMSDGEFMSAIYHSDCREAELRLNALYGTSSNEWMSLYNHESEDEAWLIDEFPAVADRLGIKDPHS
jgi:hypothetical protein